MITFQRLNLFNPGWRVPDAHILSTKLSIPFHRRGQLPKRLQFRLSEPGTKKPIYLEFSPVKENIPPRLQGKRFQNVCLPSLIYCILYIRWISPILWDLGDRGRLEGKTFNPIRQSEQHGIVKCGGSRIWRRKAIHNFSSRCLQISQTLHNSRRSISF